MTENAKRWSPRPSPPATNDNDDSDTISLTTTVDEQYPDDAEYVVEGVHAERFDGNTQKFLVEWSNFPLDQCTWEPVENLPEELKVQWEEKKSKQDPGVAVEFEQRFNDAFGKKLEESRQRHRRRNAKRRRMGIETTSFNFRGTLYPDSEDEMERVNEVGESENEDENYQTDGSNALSDFAESDEAEEDNEVEHEVADTIMSSESPYTTKLPKEPRLNRIFTFDPDKVVPKQGQNSTAKGRQTAAQPRPLKTPAVTSGSGVSSETQTNKQLDQRELQSTKRYQGSARRSSTSTAQDRQPRRNSTSAPIRPSSSAGPRTRVPPKSPVPAKKGLKAKKTVQSVNIFTEGTKRKQKAGLSTLELDKSRRPSIYRMHSLRRKAEKRTTQREDQPPDISKISLFIPGSASQHPPPAEGSQELADDNSAPLDSTDEPGNQLLTKSSNEVAPPRRTASGPTPVSSSSMRSCLNSDTGRSKKKTKSVRFTGEDDEPSVPREPRSIRFLGADEPFVSEPMDIDEAVDSPLDPPDTASAVPKTKLSLANYKSRYQQSVNKRILLCTSHDQSIDTIFDGLPKDIPSDTDQQWLKDFMNIDCLQIGHTVLAETFTDQLKSRGPQSFDYLCSGTLTSVQDNNTLETIAEHLRSGHFGLFVSQEQFNLLIYPTKCDGFQLEDLGAEDTSSDSVVLRYFMFKSIYPLARLIRGKSDRSFAPQVEVGQEKTLLFARILGVRYSHVIAGPCSHKEKHFYLAFPRRALDWYMEFCSWLYQRDPDCKIYTNFDAGSWRAFVEKAKTGCGIIIVHDAVVSLVRLFPAVSRLLQTDKNFTFWRFSESPSPQLIQRPPGGSVIPPVLSRIFSFAKAILITPSFMVSEPQETLRFFRWFFESQAHISSTKLITAYNIGEYLRDLASEKCNRQKILKQTQWRDMSQSEIAAQKVARALTNEDLEARQRTWLQVDRWLGQQVEPEVLFSEENHVIYADQFIDPNDEQSLVNWFGWWSLMHIDVYRKFYIIGSSSSAHNATKNSPSTIERVSRTIKVPRYDRAVVNDPDEALRATLPNDSEISKDRPVQNVQTDSAGWFQSQYFNNDEYNIHEFLTACDGGGGHLRIYRNPVSYLDMSMADHFGDPRMAFATFEQWWKWPLPWLKDAPRSFNTYIGFFYTIQEDWTPSNFPRSLKPKRHPWLAIYRPVEPHDRLGSYQHGRTELIIWDVRAGDELEEKHSIGLEELTWMQRELVRYLQLHAHEKNPGSFLEKVWLGGFRKHQRMCESTLPADITAEFLKIMKNNLKYVLPGTAKYLLQNGFRPVSLHSTDRTPHNATSDENSDDRQDMDIDEYQFNENNRIIFHPPRGSCYPLPRGTSKCTNDLFKAAHTAQLRDKKTREMIYTYRPTMEWYSEQVAEGRQFEHISVEGWERIFELLRINRHDRHPAPATSEKIPDQRRNNSMSSNHSSPKT